MPTAWRTLFVLSSRPEPPIRPAKASTGDFSKHRNSNLAISRHKERSRLLKVNGKDRDPEKSVKKGYWIPGGEFGSSLLYIFAPKVAAQFDWDHEESAAGMRSCIFRYRVPVATSNYVIRADQDQVTMEHHG